jgi:hypothetical protein
MKNYNIKTGQLFTDLDTPYDSESNKIDVYGSTYWTADNVVDYKIKEDLIHAFRYEDDLCTIKAWCDISGFDYWVIKQEEENYVSIDVFLKKDPELYTQQEIGKISAKIVEVDNYFEEKLGC